MATRTAPAPAPQPAAAPVAPYIGARISLISVSNIRYEGTLYTIDPREATVALQNVRCFGTENRVEGPNEQVVPPSDDVYEFIIFRGKDIRDLHVCETPPAAPAQHHLPADPAIVSSGKTPQPAAPATQTPAQQPAQPRHQPQQHQHQNRQPRHQTAREPEPADDSEFDFAASNARFSKDQIAQEMFRKDHPESADEEKARQALQGMSVSSAKYDKKKSFFDDLSSGESDNRRPDRSHDAETFGDQAAHYRPQHLNRGGRGRGRGHGRGRGRGGQYNGQGSSHQDNWRQNDGGGSGHRRGGGQRRNQQNNNE